MKRTDLITKSPKPEILTALQWMKIQTQFTAWDLAQFLPCEIARARKIITYARPQLVELERSREGSCFKMKSMRDQPAGIPFPLLGGGWGVNCRAGLLSTFLDYRAAQIEAATVKA